MCIKRGRVGLFLLITFMLLSLLVANKFTAFIQLNQPAVYVAILVRIICDVVVRVYCPVVRRFAVVSVVVV